MSGVRALDEFGVTGDGGASMALYGNHGCCALTGWWIGLR